MNENWYFVYAVFSVDASGCKSTGSPIPIWENVFLICGSDVQDAEDKMNRLGSEIQNACGRVYLDGVAVSENYEGIRKIISAKDDDVYDIIMDGSELTYSRFEVSSYEDLSKFVKGEEVNVVYVE
ncbi:MAG: hypothetical protein JW697_01990 [Kosmotogaceae bacterium]|nr:hypothetical protein [Kosmotogaceae bacterium]